MEHKENSQANSNNRIPTSHTFKKKGVYFVTIKGTCDNLYGYDGNVNAGNKVSHALVHSLWGIIVPKDSTSPLKYGWGSFFGCQNLKYVGYGVFHNITECREVPHLYDGAILAKIEPWMLYGGYKLESISYTFENCQMLTIDADVFKNCTNITNAEHAFHRCNSLVEIPRGLFDSLTKLQTVEVCFKSCTNLSKVPVDLFDKCPNITNFKQCFCGGGYNGDASYVSTMKINTALPPMWLRNNVS